MKWGLTVQKLNRTKNLQSTCVTLQNQTLAGVGHNKPPIDKNTPRPFPHFG